MFNRAEIVHQNFIKNVSKEKLPKPHSITSLKTAQLSHSKAKDIFPILIGGIFFEERVDWCFIGTQFSQMSRSSQQSDDSHADLCDKKLDVFVCWRFSFAEFRSTCRSWLV